MGLLAGAALLALALALAACGGSGGDDNGTGTPDTSGTNGEPLGTPGPDSPTVSVGTASGGVGEDVDVAAQVLGFKEPGLGAWTVDITYDPDIVSVAACAAEPGSEAQGVCNPDYGVQVVRITGAVALGIEGDTTIGVLTLHCEAAGTSPLLVSIDVIADATIGDPQETPVNVTDGSVTCGDAGAAGTPEG